MKRLIALALLLTLAACANPARFDGQAPVAVEPALELAPAVTDCQPGDDGIGGTGCPVE